MIASSGVNFGIGGDRAFYDDHNDFVQVPPPQAYFEPIHWHHTALRGLGHATGHVSVFGRDLINRLGNRDYAGEELCAELAAAIVSLRSESS